MLASSAPGKFNIPWANAGTKTAIPQASQIAVTPGRASLTDGFPPLTFTAPSAGGVNPFGADFNGIMNQVTSAVQFGVNAGACYPYDAAFQTAIGGYPKGATVFRSNGTGAWLSLTDNNVTNPDTGGAGWTPAEGFALTGGRLTGQVQFFTVANDTIGTTGIVANPNGWSRIDPNGSSFFIPVNASSDVATSRLILAVQRTDTLANLWTVLGDGSQTVNNLTAAGSVKFSTAGSVTAFAGGGQAGATLLTGQISKVFTVATAGDSVRLPAASQGTCIFVMNVAANACRVFPFGTETINTIPSTVGVLIQPGQSVYFTTTGTTTWQASMTSAPFADNTTPLGLPTQRWSDLRSVTATIGTLAVTGTATATAPAVSDDSATLVTSAWVNAIPRNSKPFTASNTFAVPAGVHFMRMRVWGGAGGGGGTVGASSAASGACGAGYSEGVFPVTPGQVLTIGVGAAGVGGTGATTGTSGGTSSVAGFLQATGGSGGFGANASVQTTVGTPGVGTGGALNVLGQGAGAGATQVGAFFGGTGGGTYGTSGSSGTTTGSAGYFPGGGGGGGAASGPGGNGGAGLVILEY